MFIGGLIIVSMRPDKILNIGFDGGYSCVREARIRESLLFRYFIRFFDVKRRNE